MNRKMWIALGVFLFGCCLSLASWHALARTSSAPSLVLDCYHLEDAAFQQDPYQQKESDCVLEWVLHNKGVEPLQIANIDLSCGCMAHSLSKDEVGRGESAILSVRVARNWNLDRNVAIMIETNDPKQCSVRLTAHVASRNAVPYLAPTNMRTVGFGMYAQPGDQRTVEIASFEKKSQEWLRVISSDLRGLELEDHGFVDEETSNFGVVKRKRMLLLRVKEGVSSGSIGGWVKLIPDLADSVQDEHTFVVSGQVAGIIAFPSVVMIPKVGAEAIKREIRLVAGQSWNFMVLAINPPQGTRIERLLDHENNVETLHLLIVPDECPKNIQEFVFETNHPMSPEVHVKIFRH